MTAFVLALLTVAAPVPKGPPAPHEVKVGWRWHYGNEVLAVHEVEGERVTFRCLTDPHRSWPGHSLRRLSTDKVTKYRRGRYSTSSRLTKTRVRLTLLCSPTRRTPGNTGSG